MRRAVLAAAALFALAGTAAAAQGRNDGRTLYDVHCSSCHGAALQGGSQAPPLINVDAAMVDFMLQTGRMPAAAPWEQEYHRSPAFTKPQIAAIVDYVMSRSSGDKSLPAVHLPPAGWGLRKGRQVFAENCEQCHGASARGNGAVGYRDIAPSLMDATPLEIAEAVREGPGQMPTFGPGVIDAENLNNLVAYVEFLKRGQYNPGGLQLANLGPVAEAFVLWAVGMSALVLLARRIGSVE